MRQVSSGRFVIDVSNLARNLGFNIEMFQVSRGLAERAALGWKSNHQQPSASTKFYRSTVLPFYRIRICDDLEFGLVPIIMETVILRVFFQILVVVSYYLSVLPFCMFRIWTCEV
jgi:hypothetical protein